MDAQHHHGVVSVRNPFCPSRIRGRIPFPILAALVVTLALGFYLKLRFAMGAIVSLIHDVMITIGVFSLMDKEFTLTIIAAILTIIGYSLNDTIVVFDRIRENTRKYQREPYEKVINGSINETLSRTLLTNGTTLAVIVPLFVSGGRHHSRFCPCAAGGHRCGDLFLHLRGKPDPAPVGRGGKSNQRP